MIKQYMKIAVYWFLGFVLLLGTIVLMKRVLFEFLHWNGTTKNDWAYILWWIVVFAWTFFGTTLIKKKDQTVIT